MPAVSRSSPPPLPTGRQVGCLFVDLNSFFASAEQHLRPELRGRPVGVTPVSAETTCFIAVSVEAKRLGLRTGMPVREGLRRCRGLRVVIARPHEYVRLHHRLVAAVEDVVPVESVESIDEMNCRLRGPQRRLEVALDLAAEVKRAIAGRVGPTLRCSVGLAPNRFLAKVACGMHKPDGLTVVTPDMLPWGLYGLALDDLPGIGPRMLGRLHRAGVTTVAELYARPIGGLEEIWGGVVGWRWWHWLRGAEVSLPVPQTRSLGHSHVLPPPLRTEAGAYAVLCRLVHKAAARLRRGRRTARRMEVEIGFAREAGAWRARAELGLCRDTQTMLAALATLWAGRPRPAGGTRGVPFKVAVTLLKLAPDDAAPRPLFAEDRRRERLSAAMDRVNARFGVDALYFACMHAARRTAPMRIAFGVIPNHADGWEDRFAADPEAGGSGTQGPVAQTKPGDDPRVRRASVRPIVRHTPRPPFS